MAAVVDDKQADQIAVEAPDGQAQHDNTLQRDLDGIDTTEVLKKLFGSEAHREISPITVQELASLQGVLSSVVHNQLEVDLNVSMHLPPTLPELAGALNLSHVRAIHVAGAIVAEHGLTKEGYGTLTFKQRSELVHMITDGLGMDIAHDPVIKQFLALDYFSAQLTGDEKLTELIAGRVVKKTSDIYSTRTEIEAEEKKKVDDLTRGKSQYLVELSRLVASKSEEVSMRDVLDDLTFIEESYPGSPKEVSKFINNIAQVALRHPAVGIHKLIKGTRKLIEEKAHEEPFKVEHAARGFFNEAQAAVNFASHGYTIEAMSVTELGGRRLRHRNRPTQKLVSREIDLIVSKGGREMFIEVKSNPHAFLHKDYRALEELDLHHSANTQVDALQTFATRHGAVAVIAFANSKEYEGSKGEIEQALRYSGERTRLGHPAVVDISGRLLVRSNEYYDLPRKAK